MITNAAHYNPINVDEDEVYKVDKNKVDKNKVDKNKVDKNKVDKVSTCPPWRTIDINLPPTTE